MNLYRIDHTDGQGVRSAVTDLLGPVLLRQRKHADRIAREVVADDGGTAEITRISGAGALKLVKVVR